MGVDFRWQSGQSEVVLPRSQPRPRRWPVLALLALLALGGLVAWRARRGSDAARADLQRLVEQEVLALQAGERDLFLSLIERTPFEWRRYHELNFRREAAWYAARANARPVVEGVRLEPGGARVGIRLSDGTHTWRGTWFFLRSYDGRWLHTAPPPGFWGEPHTAEMPHVRVQAPDARLASSLATELEALYGEISSTYGPLPSAAADTARTLPALVVVRVTPDVAGPEAHMRTSDERWYFDYPPPGLGLELWTPEEQSAILARDARTTLARLLLANALPPSQPEPAWRLADSLAVWHARAWQPGWERYVRSSLADGTGSRFLALWLADGATSETDADCLFRDLGARYGELEMGEWWGALNYTVGEFLGSRCPAGQQGALLRATARHASLADALQAELGLTQPELEAAWLAYLEERYGPTARTNQGVQ